MLIPRTNIASNATCLRLLLFLTLFFLRPDNSVAQTNPLDDATSLVQLAEIDKSTMFWTATEIYFPRKEVRNENFLLFLRCIEMSDLTQLRQSLGALIRKKMTTTEIIELQKIFQTDFMKKVVRNQEIDRLNAFGVATKLRKMPISQVETFSLEKTMELKVLKKWNSLQLFEREDVKNLYKIVQLSSVGCLKAESPPSSDKN